MHYKGVELHSGQVIHDTSKNSVLCYLYYKLLVLNP